LAVVIGGSAQAATPPNVLLGTAAPFAVLAGSGITNTGASTISGDTGSSPTAVETGFALCPAANCVAQTGANHTSPDPNDAATQGAKADLTTAYNDAAGRTPTAVPTELAGQTLVGGVYTSATGTFGMSGTLILDGANNADSVFIFQTGSTLITAGAANVALINGAQACNVYWQVGSAATLGAASSFVGTILAHDDISVGLGVTVQGRLLAGEQASGTGAVTLMQDTITTPTACVTQASINAATAAAQAQAAAAATAAATATAAANAATAAAAAALQASTTVAATAAAATAAAAAKQAAQAAEVATAAAVKAAAAAKGAAAMKAAKSAAVARAAAAKAANARELAKKVTSIRKAKAHGPAFTG
jgi:type VI secretion system secreted protein VgrG